MDWLFPFAALALISGMVAAILPEGSLRKTAMMVMGVTLTLSWVDGLYTLLDWPELPQEPATVLTVSAPVMDDAAQVQLLAAQLEKQLSRQTGVSVRIILDESGSIASVSLPQGASSQAVEIICSALGIVPEKISVPGR